MRKLRDSLYKFLISRKVAVWLLAGTLALMAASASLPMPEDISEAERPLFSLFVRTFGTAGVTSSYYFLLLPGMIFLSVLICTIDRIRRQRNRDIGFWGSITFHAGLLTVIAAGVITMSTLFSAEMLLTEGVPFPLGREGLIKVTHEPLTGIRLPEGTVTLESFKSIYKGDEAVDHQARLRLDQRGRSKEVLVRVNDPFILDGIQYSVNMYGFSPSFVVEDEDGSILLDAAINLLVAGGQEDFFDIPEKGIRVFVRLHPDFEMTKDGPRSRSPLPNNPVAAVKVKRGLAETKFRHIKLGESETVGGLRINFSALNYWNHFLVSRDHGQPVLIAGVILLVSGLVVRFITRLNLDRQTDRGERENND